MAEPLPLEAVRRLVARPQEARLWADALREEAAGDEASFVVNRNINFTDVCANGCLFCAFANRSRYLLSPDEVASRAREAAASGATEVCLQGGLHPSLSLSDYVGLVRAVRRAAPQVHVHAFSPQEVVHAARQEGCGVEDALRELRSAGLGSMPGTAAEVLVDRVRREVCPGKIGSATWLAVVRCAHSLGIPTSATMLYGVGEGWGDRLAHLALLRSLQEETGGFTEFVPLSFVHPNTPLHRATGRRSPGRDTDLLVLAVARLALHPLFANVQVSWPKLGDALAAEGLRWGANDVGGTLGEENITRLAGGRHGTSRTPGELAALLRGAGRRPVQRDTLYTSRRRV